MYGGGADSRAQDYNLYIQDLILNNPSIFKQIDENMEYDIKKTCKEMKTINPVCPFNLFAMNLSELQNVLTTALTYIIVLMQLKTAEMPLKA